MRLNAKVILKQIPMAALLEAYKPVEVLGYCASCSNFKRNHTCPEFSFSVEDMLENYKYATVIMTRIPTDVIKAKADSISEMPLTSRVYTNYVKHNPDVKTDWTSKLSMYVFNHIKDTLADRLLEVEAAFSGSVSLPPGSCTKCTICTRTQNKACLAPESLRYSLEALGFMVSDIYESVFGESLGWTKDDLPEAFHTCSALLSKSELVVEDLEKLIGPVSCSLDWRS